MAQHNNITLDRIHKIQYNYSCKGNKLHYKEKHGTQYEKKNQVKITTKENFEKAKRTLRNSRYLLSTLQKHSYP